VAVDTHVLESGSGLIVAFDRFRRFNGTSRVALNLWALPLGMDYRQAAGRQQHGPAQYPDGGYEPDRT